jgi:protein-disulfide isomerase
MEILMKNQNTRDRDDTPTSKLIQPVAGRDHIQGRLDAPIVLIEYGDYECPYCGEVYPTVKAIQQRLGNRLCFVFRNFPLLDSHPHAQHAAEAAEAAGLQGKFWEMHDLLFEHQDALTDEDITGHATALGLDASRLLREVLSGALAPRVQEDVQSGTRAGVHGTPTFFINGERYDAALGLHALLADVARPSV